MNSAIDPGPATDRSEAIDPPASAATRDTPRSTTMYPATEPATGPGTGPATEPQTEPGTDLHVTPVPDAPPPEPARRGRSDGRRQVALLLAASLLSAGLASTATSALERGGSAAAITATTTTATTTGTTATSGSTLTAAVKGTATTTNAVVSATAAVSPAVVTITTTAAQAGPFGSSSGTGSGFIYGADGWILTNYHVVEGAASIKVTLVDGRAFAGTVVASDATADLAVVKVKASGLPTASLGSSAALELGTTVIAIGDPLGEFSGSVTVGVISGVDRSITVADSSTRRTRDLSGLLQTDAAINEGNSGGPLVDLSGHVVGIVTAGSSSAQGIGFAIPIDAAKSIMAKAAAATQHA